jgi:hypothetical protein
MATSAVIVLAAGSALFVIVFVGAGVLSLRSDRPARPARHRSPTAGLTSDERRPVLRHPPEPVPLPQHVPDDDDGGPPVFPPYVPMAVRPVGPADPSPWRPVPELSDELIRQIHDARRHYTGESST